MIAFGPLSDHTAFTAGEKSDGRHAGGLSRLNS